MADRPSSAPCLDAAVRVVVWAWVIASLGAPALAVAALNGWWDAGRLFQGACPTVCINLAPPPFGPPPGGIDAPARP